MTDYQIDFISNLKKFRQIKNLSQAELAEKCDVTTGTIGNIECGLAKPSFDLIVKLSSVLEIHPAMLFATEDQLLVLCEKAQTSKDRILLEHLYSEIRLHLQSAN